MSTAYDDIIDLPHPLSLVHPPMPVMDRAAQFVPFAALTGYDEAVAEAARVTEAFQQLADDEQSEINRSLKYLCEHRCEKLRIAAVYFVPDDKKAGGRYVSASGIVKRIDEYSKEIVFDDGEKIKIKMLRELEIKKNF